MFRRPTDRRQRLGGCTSSPHAKPSRHRHGPAEAKVRPHLKLKLRWVLARQRICRPALHGHANMILSFATERRHLPQLAQTSAFGLGATTAIVRARCWPGSRGWRQQRIPESVHSDHRPVARRVSATVPNSGGGLMVAKLTAVMRRIAPKVWLWPLHVTHGT
jgi:hypothetical protein